jgi:hypothetical protein
LRCPRVVGRAATAMNCPRFRGASQPCDEARRMLRPSGCLLMYDPHGRCWLDRAPTARICSAWWLLALNNLGNLRPTDSESWQRLWAVGVANVSVVLGQAQECKKIDSETDGSFQEPSRCELQRPGRRFSGTVARRQSAQAADPWTTAHSSSCPSPLAERDDVHHSGSWVATIHPPNQGPGGIQASAQARDPRGPKPASDLP